MTSAGRPLHQHQTILITGVSSGIGNGLADYYLRRGDTVLGVSRREPDNLNSQHFHFLSLDLCDEVAVKSQLPELLAGHPNIDTVVLNAGILGRISDMKDVSLADLKAVMDTNVWSYKTVLDVVIAVCQKIDKVITISSGAAINGNRGWSGYSISKAALNMLTMLYARENDEIHFAAVAPGLVDTVMQDYLCGHEPDVRFPSLESLKSRRGSSEMPNPGEASKKLVSLFDCVEKHVESGGFVDIRHLPEFD